MFNLPYHTITKDGPADINNPAINAPTNKAPTAAAESQQWTLTAHPTSLTAPVTPSLCFADTTNTHISTQEQQQPLLSASSCGCSISQLPL
jgi:hypothetical protein